MLTYFVDDDLSGRKLKLTTIGRTELTSLNELQVPPAGCNGETCDAGAYCAGTCVQVRQGEGRGVLGWICVVIGIGLGALFLLGAIGFVMTKRQQAQAAGPGAGAAPGVPGSVPPGAKLPSQPPVARPTAGFPSAPPQPVPAPTTGPRLYIMSGPRTGEPLGLRHGFMIGKPPRTATS